MLRNRRQKFNPIIFIGLIILSLAGSARLLLQHNTHLSESNVDGAIGFLMGLAIGFMIVVLVRLSRRSKCETDSGHR